MSGVDQQAAVATYKRLLKQTLSTPERKRMQSILAKFVETKSFELFQQELPTLINTPNKLKLAPAIRALIPPKYHMAFDAMIGHITNTGRGLDGDAIIPIKYQNWNGGSSEAFKDVSFSETDAKMYENLKEISVERNALLYENCSRDGSEQNAPDLYAEPNKGRAAAKKPEALAPPPLMPKVKSGQTSPTPPPLMPKVKSGRQSPEAPPPPPKSSSAGSGAAGGAALPPPLPQKANPNAYQSSIKRSISSSEHWDRTSYFAGQISRKDAEERLQDKGMGEGSFLVRAKGDNFAVSVVAKASPVHLLCQRDAARQFTINGESFGPHTEIEDLINALKKLGTEFEYPLRKPLYL